eukprot:3713646-Pleurochrysis_carterae.AAC.1
MTTINTASDNCIAAGCHAWPWSLPPSKDYFHANLARTIFTPTRDHRRSIMPARSRECAGTCPLRRGCT